MFLVRVALPDRPGSLGAVASALGTVHADISAVEIVERGEGVAIDDFILSVPVGVPADSIVAVCTAIPGVEVVWLSYYPEPWGLQPDVDVLNQMMQSPREAELILTEAAPAAFHVTWSALIDRGTLAVLRRTELAPELDAEAVGALGDLGRARAFAMAPGWIRGWNETLLAVAPFRGSSGHSIVMARNGGPEFLPSEVGRLRHLAALADVH